MHIVARVESLHGRGGGKNHLCLVRGGKSLCPDFVFPQTGAICMPSASSSLSLGRTDQLLLSLLRLLIIFQARTSEVEGGGGREKNNIC